ncbi:MAG: hypothetical protein JW927_06450 [Deltaproteobacteria bacterium]|nr:hypothetical protein [Deltaproteobacteria bacterium]
MIRRFTILLTFVVCSILFTSNGLVAEDQKSWSSNFELMSSHIKPTTKTEKDYCENLLKNILHELDTLNQCNNDNDCSLIDQKPFGETVPFPTSQVTSMKMRMEEYCERCDDKAFHQIKNQDLINKPVCVDKKCKVSTSLKK